MNFTRDHARLLQQGVMDSRKWQYGPLVFIRAEYRYSTGYAVLLTLGRLNFQLGLTVTA